MCLDLKTREFARGEQTRRELRIARVEHEGLCAEPREHSCAKLNSICVKHAKNDLLFELLIAIAHGLQPNSDGLHPSSDGFSFGQSTTAVCSVRQPATNIMRPFLKIWRK